jgi:hypothetical protein
MKGNEDCVKGEGIESRNKENKQTKLGDLSPRTNYTDRATAACRLS